MGMYLNIPQAVAIWMKEMTTHQFKPWEFFGHLPEFSLQRESSLQIQDLSLGKFTAQAPVIMSISLPFFNWIREFPLIFHSCGIWGWASAAVFFTILGVRLLIKWSAACRLKMLKVSRAPAVSPKAQGTFQGTMLTRALDLARYLLTSQAKLLKQGLASHLPVDTSCYWHECWNPPNISPSPRPSQVHASGKPHSFARQQGRSCAWRHRQISLLQASKYQTESPHPISSPKQALH